MRLLQYRRATAGRVSTASAPSTLSIQARSSAVASAKASDDSGKSFGPAIEVSADKPVGHVGAVLLDNGDLVVSWQRRVGNGGAELCLRRVSSTGEMGNITVIDEAADMFAMSVPQIVRNGDDLVLAWTVKEGEAYGVQTAMVPFGYLD